MSGARAYERVAGLLMHPGLREPPQMRRARLARERRARRRLEAARSRARRQLVFIEVIRGIDLEWQLNGALLEQMAAVIQRPDRFVVADQSENSPIVAA